MLKPGNQKTHRAYLWAYAPGVFEDIKAVVYDFCESRTDEHARTFLGDWKGALVCDDFAGYKQSFTLGVTEAGCMGHSRRKFFDLQVSNKSQIAAPTDHRRLGHGQSPGRHPQTLGSTHALPGRRATDYSSSSQTREPPQPVFAACLRFKSLWSA